jgi:hypothetical protein
MTTPMSASALASASIHAHSAPYSIQPSSRPIAQTRSSPRVMAAQARDGRRQDGAEEDVSGGNIQ